MKANMFLGACVLMVSSWMQLVAANETSGPMVGGGGLDPRVHLVCESAEGSSLREIKYDGFRGVESLDSTALVKEWKSIQVEQVGLNQSNQL